MCKEISIIIQKFPAGLQSTSNMHSRVGILAKKKKRKMTKQELQTGHAGLTFSGKKKREEKTFSRSHKICIGVCCPRSHNVKILRVRRTKTDTVFKAKTRKVRFRAKTKTKNSVETHNIP